jgi:NADH-quinone oxidoreductase subunit L
MTFVFWELVGICSYFLIGFYIERKSASNAANKAFIVNRVGDFGMIIGLMALWSSLGTFNFGDIDGQPGLFQQVRPAGVVAETGGAESHGASHSLIVPDAMVVEAAKGEIAAAGDADYAATVDSNLAAWRDPESSGKKGGLGYGLLVVAGIGIFCGCVGKSAQFPLHVWLPDAMEGPTPVSALVHSATMVAAGVYLVGRFYPVFAPEVLLVIAVVGCITLFMAATIAITATDIKRVLAYSTVSQLGYMMLALGVGGWLAGIMHLFTHAFFKSLLFMCSGSVIHAVHTNEMPLMGGLRKKMPWTAYTMLIGCLAIAGAGVPFLVGFSGYYSKDAILEQAFLFKGTAGNSGFAAIFFFAAAGGAAITAFYMFRLWYMTFAGEPRDQARYDHAHESPPVMYVPLVVLAVMAVGAAWGMNSVFTQLSDAIVGGVIALLVIGGVWAYGRATGNADQEHGSAEASRGASHHGDGHHGRSGHGHEEHGHQSQGHGSHGHDAHGHDAHDGHGHHHAAEPSLKVPAILAGLVVVAGFVWLLFPGLSLANLLEQSRPAGILQAQTGRIIEWTWPNEHDSHAPDIKFWATCTATATAWGGFLLATVLYGWRVLDPQDVRRTFAPVYKFLVNKWWFDELYEVLFVRPTHWVAGIASAFDRKWIDGFINGLAWSVRAFATFWDRIADRTIIDGFVNTVAGWTYQAGLSLRSVQTGKLRQYVTFIVVGTVIVFALASFFWSSALGS